MNFSADTPVEQLPNYNDLSYRLRKRLTKIPKRGDRLTLKDIVSVTDSELLKINGLGNVCATEMRNWRTSVEIKVGLRSSDDLILAAERVLELRHKVYFKHDSHLGKALDILEKEVRRRKVEMLDGLNGMPIEDRINELEKKMKSIEWNQNHEAEIT